jgi:ATP-dependent RNA helicase DeaD
MPFPSLPAAFEAALAAQDYHEPTPVQAAVLAEKNPDADLLVSAQTGSGKTVAFGLSIGRSLLDGADRFGPPGAPQALIIAPTRELAQQVARELEWLYAKTGAIVACCVGGMDARQEARGLARGCHLLVGTPGRLRDHMERGNVDFNGLAAVVLDEADEMLDLGFRDDLEALLEAAPAERRTLLFSATLAREIVSLARAFQKDAVRIDTTDKTTPHADIEYKALRVAPNEIERATVNALRYYGASVPSKSGPGKGAALVFCSTRDRVRQLYGSLRERGFGVVALSGELNQKDRSEALQSLRDGHARVCVATDVAARGLDLPDLNLVIHADLPQNKATLLHRSGRTGRAGRKGMSILLVATTRKRKAEMLLREAGLKATWSAPPSAESIHELDREILIKQLVADAGASEDDAALADLLVEKAGPRAVALALIRAQRTQLPDPEELFDPGGADGEVGASRRDRDGPSGQGGIWFSMPVGRESSADPKWLIPLICRVGHITKRDIGTIRIFPDETLFEIAPGIAERFFNSAKNHAEEGMEITPSSDPGDRRAPPRRNSEMRNEKRASSHKARIGHERDARPGKRDRQDSYERAPERQQERSSYDARPERPARAERPDRAERPERPARSKPYDGKPAGYAVIEPDRSGFKGKPKGAKPGGAKPGKAGKKPFKKK